MNGFLAGKYFLPLDKSACVMGILNVTPDSFSDGGLYFDPKAAAEHALEMQEQGAGILDIGAQSTRPGFEKILPEREWERLAPVLQGLRGKIRIPVSVDTFYPRVAELALQNGADIINDVTGFQNPEMFRIAADTDCGCVVMHNGHVLSEDPGTDILVRIKTFFLHKLEEAGKFGIAPERICFDPGFGFGKTYGENLRILANVGRIRVNGCAFLMAASRKGTIGKACGSPPAAQRMAGTIAAHTIAQAGGAQILRAHDVPEAVQAARVADAVLAAREGNDANG